MDLQRILEIIAEYAILFFDYAGVLALIVSGIRGVIHFVRRDPAIRLNLAKGMAISLEFKLGGEILRTVVVRTFEEIAIAGAVILLRAALAILIHWEIKVEENSRKAEAAGSSDDPHSF